jgi:hypothetical protein
MFYFLVKVNPLIMTQQFDIELGINNLSSLANICLDTLRCQGLIYVNILSKNL